MTPSVVVEKMYGIDRTLSLQANCVATLTLTLGCIFWGWLEDKIGSRVTLALSWGGLAITAFHFYSALSPDIAAASLVINYAVMGFLSVRLPPHQSSVRGHFRRQSVSPAYPLPTTWLTRYSAA